MSELQPGVPVALRGDIQPVVSRTANHVPWLAGAALLAVAAGTLLALATLSTLSDDLRRIRRRAADLDQLRRLEAGWRSDQLAVQKFEDLRTHQPTPLAELAAKNIAGAPPAIRLRESIPAAAGWTLRRAAVKLDDVRMEDLTRLLAAAESSRPPWRLAEFALTASDTAGAGRAMLVFEALEKKDGVASAAPGPTVAPAAPPPPAPVPVTPAPFVPSAVPAAPTPAAPWSSAVTAP
ncbi:MAG: hypothetical protein NTV49_11220 [Kiritimatiellaeota bacterium]|nr:hypothetical protein [Kiritimatiellota bacterium]